MTVKGLEDLGAPSYLKIVIDVAKRLTAFSPDKNEFGKPSKALKLGILFFFLKGAEKVVIGQTPMKDDDLAGKGKKINKMKSGALRKKLRKKNHFTQCSSNYRRKEME